MSKPITPAEAVKKKTTLIPDAVFDAFNELIAKNLVGNSSTVKQDDAVAMIASRLSCSRQHVFDQHWLDIEDSYSEAGWKVVYDEAEGR